MVATKVGKKEADACIQARVSGKGRTLFMIFQNVCFAEAPTFGYLSPR